MKHAFIGPDILAAVQYRVTAHSAWSTVYTLILIIINDLTKPNNLTLIDIVLSVELKI